MLELSKESIEPSAAHPPGALIHLYVISGRLRTGLVRDPVQVSPGDFVRFHADIVYEHVALTAKAVVHMVVTLPQVAQLGPVGTGSGR